MTMIRRDVPLTLTTREAPGTTGHVIEGVAVPLDTPTEIFHGYTEQIASGAVDLAAHVALVWRHDEPIGVVTSLTEEDGNLCFTAHVSDTQLGRDAWTLARDGAIRSASIGFWELDYTDTHEDDDTILRTQTRIDLREISLVTVPAYEGATLTSTRHRTTQPHKEAPTMDTTPDLETVTRSITSLGEGLDTLTRRLSLLETQDTSRPATAETRSGGTLLKAALAGDESARAALAPLVGRSPATTTSADGRYHDPVFVKDLTRLITVLNPLSSLFSTGTLPAEGDTLEFAQLKSNTVTVDKQAAEGDTLPVGKIETRTMTATIATYGGGATLSIQAIERSRSNILDLHLRALTMTAAKQLAAAFATFYTTQVAAQASRAITTTKAADALDWKSLLHMMLDAKDAYEDQALPLDGLIVDRPTFEAITGMTDTTGRPILTPTGATGTNQIGAVSASGAYASLDGLRVIANRHTTLTGAVGAFYSADALRVYSSGTTSLQDTSVLDLTRAFSIYFYAAFAPEIPEGLVPLKTGA